MSQGAAGDSRVQLIPLLGVAGSVAVIVGVLLPVVVPAAPGTGESFHVYDPMNGKMLLALAGLSFILTWVFQWYRGLWFTGLGSLAIVALTLIRFQRDGKTLGVDWALIGAGVVLLVAAALLAEIRWRRQRDLPAAAEIGSTPEEE
ncbi:MAG TPA: hypothetical protein VG013_06370 [Gemmataceae bacterium]|jgi:hypothetical protein|nr:hypothetical protein [Gemmataceae bacterium]